jgi:acyl-coenzyme A thioesterase PaaI-like protein
LKPVNVTIDFMRNAEAQRTFAVGRVVRAGRRLVNVTAEAWQADRERVIASAWMNVMLARG